MRSIIYISLITWLFLFSSCCNQNKESSQEAKVGEVVAPTQSTGNFGKLINDGEAISSSQLPELLKNRDTVNLKLKGDVAAVCQMSGCWMDMHISEDVTIHVTFKDEAFLLPKDATGKTAIIEGVATYEEIPVDMLKHMAIDEGKTQVEIDAITAPKIEYNFVASGVILYEPI